ncbi:MAG: DUF1622 domain-containing protein [Bdellovibrionia bacterium]
MSALPPDFFHFSGWAAVIEFVGALVIVSAIVRAVFTLRHPFDVQRARLIVADGAVAGLSFKVAATLLKTVALQSWHQIAMFAVILALRTVIKTEFNWQIKSQNYRKQAFQAR